MVVAKRQEREKPIKIEQRKIQRPEWGPQVEQTALPASPIYIAQAQGKEKKHVERGAKGPGVSLPLSCSPFLSLLFATFGLACSHASRMYFLLFSKLNWAVTRSGNTDLSKS